MISLQQVFYRGDSALRMVVPGMCALLFLSSGLLAQPGDWTPEQREVWKRVEEYSDASRRRDLNGYLGYFHPDFAGWLNGTDTTTDKNVRGKMLAWYFDNTTPVSVELEPVAIRVIGACAVVHYRIREVLRMKDGTEESGVEYWTDVLVKQDGEWLLLADHGGKK